MIDEVGLIKICPLQANLSIGLVDQWKIDGNLRALPLKTNGLQMLAFNFNNQI